MTDRKKEGGGEKEEESNEILTYSRSFKWSSCLEKKSEFRDQNIYLEQAEEGFIPDERDIFTLTTRPREDREDEDESIDIYFKDFDRIISLLQQAQQAVKDGYCNVDVHELDEKEKEDLK